MKMFANKNSKNTDFEKINKSSEFSISGKNIKSKNFMQFQNYSTIDLSQNGKNEKYRNCRKNYFI